MLFPPAPTSAADFGSASRIAHDTPGCFAAAVAVGGREVDLRGGREGETRTGGDWGLGVVVLGRGVLAGDLDLRPNLRNEKGLLDML